MPIFMIFNSLNSFSFDHPIKKYQYKKSNSKLNWKW